MGSAEFQLTWKWIWIWNIAQLMYDQILFVGVDWIVKLDLDEKLVFLRKIRFLIFFSSALTCIIYLLCWYYSICPWELTEIMTHLNNEFFMCTSCTEPARFFSLKQRFAAFHHGFNNHHRNAHDFCQFFGHSWFIIENKNWSSACHFSQMGVLIVRFSL